MGLEERAAGIGGSGSWSFIWVVVKIRVPFCGTLNSRCRIILGTQNGTIFLTTTHMMIWDCLRLRDLRHRGFRVRGPKP